MKTVKQINDNLRKTMDRDAMPILENIFDILRDGIELYKVDSMIRSIKLRNS